MKLTKEEIGLLYYLVSSQIMTSWYLTRPALVKEQMSVLLAKLDKEAKKNV
jgi:hypothetical protein